MKTAIIKPRFQSGRDHLSTLLFAECGREYSLEDLIEIKDQGYVFLAGLLDGMNNYNDDEEYLNATSNLGGPFVSARPGAHKGAGRRRFTSAALPVILTAEVTVITKPPYLTRS